MRVGWIQDTHTKADPTDSAPGAQQQLVDMIDDLGAKGCDTIIHTGDLVHPELSRDIPHVTEDEFDRFWSLVDQSSYGDLLEYAVPGNHDIPLQTYLESDERAKLTERVDFDADGVTIILLNTQATGYTTGSSSAGGNQGGAATEIPRVALRDIEWMDEQLADSGSNAKLILPHAPTYFQETAEYGAVQSNNGTMGGGASYQITWNFNYIHETLKQYDKVVEPTSHVYDHTDEGSEQTDGVWYAWKLHTYDHPSDSVQTYAYIDIDSSGCTITTVDYSDGSENVILDTTF